MSEEAASTTEAEVAGGAGERAERDLLRRIGRIYVPIAPVASSLALVQGWASQTLTVWLLVQQGVVLGSVPFIWWLRHHPRLQRDVLVSAACAVSFLSLLHYGPHMGVGWLLSATALGATFFYGFRGGAALLLLTLAVLGIAALGLAHGWLSLQWAPASPGAWAQIAISVAATQATVAGAFYLVMVRLRRAIAAEAVARYRATAAERAREKTLQGVANAHRLEALGRLAGGVAHDFNNALAIVRAGIATLEDGPRAEDAAEVIRDMKAAAEAAASTTRQLHAFARGGVLSGQPADPAAVLASVAAALRRLFPENVAISVDARETPAIALSAGLLEQVLVNLALNARDAMGPGGGRIELGCHRLARSVVIRVNDDGVGMDEATRVRAFEPFFTTKGERGTGLGLAMVHGTVARAGGRVDVESTRGIGTTFEIEVPCAKAVARESIVSPLRANPGAQGARVLLLEDEPPLLRAMQRELRRDRFEVTTAAGVQDALQALGHGSFDVLCTDGVLRDGRAASVVAEYRRRAGHGAPVLVCSGYMEDELLLEGVEWGAYRFLAKPYEPGALTRTIRDMLATRDLQRGPRESGAGRAGLSDLH